jgi:hypothetical protein
MYAGGNQTTGDGGIEESRGGFEEENGLDILSG